MKFKMLIAAVAVISLCACPLMLSEDSDAYGSTVVFIDNLNGTNEIVPVSDWTHRVDCDMFSEVVYPTHSGYTFDGWYTKSGEEYDPYWDPVYTDMAVFAEWTPAESQSFSVPIKTASLVAAVVAALLAIGLYWYATRD